MNQVGNKPERHISLPAMVKGQKGLVKTKCIVDTGNTLNGSCAINSEFHRKLGIGFQKIQKKSIGTAKKAAQLTLLGISNPIEVKFEGISTKFLVSPRVIEDLHADLNLSNLFLKKVGAKMDFSMERTILQIGDEKTELIQQMQPRKKEKRESRSEDKKPKKRKREKSSGLIHLVTAQADVKCKPNSLTFVPIRRQRGMIRVQTLDEDDTCQPIGALYRNTDKIAILNLGETSRKIYKGNCICQMQYVKRNDEAEARDERVENIRTETDIDPGSPEEENKIQVLWEQLKLDENKLLAERPDVREKVFQILRKHWKVFSSEARLIGETDLIEFEIELEPGTKPHRGKVRPLNPTMKKSLKDQLDLWVKEGVAEECFSPWASPMVPVAKPCGGTRWCVDYRRLNTSTVADSYPLPNISENIDRLAGGKIFSTLDASQAYHTIPVTEGSKKALAFITPFGLYTFARMPFGARNAGATYSRFVQLCLDKLRSQYTMAYLDDIIMFTPTLDLHVEELERVLAMHEQAGIKLNARKTHLFKEEVDYLGFRIYKDGVKMKESYIEKILQWPSPKSTKEMRSFLGFCGYYRSFIRGYSRLTNEMNAQRSSKKFEWTEQMEKNFKKLKKKFQAMPIRSFPRFDIEDPFQMTTDWSRDNVSAILSQVQDGQERLIAVFGRKTTKGERNYAPWKGELSAMIYGIRKAEHILRYRPFIANTDASALVHLRRLKALTGILARWMQELQTYNFTVKHKPGVENANADGVSRSSHMPEEEPEDWDEGIVADIHEEVNRDLDREVIVNAQKEDPELAQVRRWLTEGKPSHEEAKDLSESLKTYAQQEIKEEADGMLVRRVVLNKSTSHVSNVILVPEKFKDAVYYWSHQHTSAGHFSAQPTIMRAKTKWYYPGMFSELKRKIRSCSACLAKARVNDKDCAYKPRKSGFPGERLNIDLVGPLPVSPSGCKYILTIEDAFSRFVQAIPIKTKEAKHVADALIERHICTFGCPLEILSDQGGEFVNRTWEELCKRLEIKKKVTVPYNQRSNPVERFHRTLNQILRTFMDRDDPGWERYLPMSCLAYNSKCHSATGQTPFLVWMGREARLPLDIIVPTPHQQYETVEQHTEDVLRRFQLMYSQVKEHNEAVFRRNARLHTGNLHDYKVDDRVFYYTGRRIRGKPLKITFGWLGPYKVTKKVSDVIFVLTPADREGDEVNVHVTRMRPYFGPRETGRAIFPGVTDLEDLGDELAEELTSPVVWVRPTDEFHNVPVKWGVPAEMIRDLPKKKVTKDAAQQSEPVAGAKRKVHTNTSASKRDRSESPTRPARRNWPQPGRSGTHEPAEKRDRSEEIDPRPSRRDGPQPGRSGTKEPATKRDRSSSSSDNEGPVRNSTGPARNRPRLSQGDKRKAEETQVSLKKKLTKLLSETESSSSKTSSTSDEESVEAVMNTEEKHELQIRSAQKTTIPAHGVEHVKLKTAEAVPADCWLLVFSRPNLARKGIKVDAMVRQKEGEMTATVRNEGDREIRIEKGQRLAQGVLVPVCGPSTVAGRVAGATSLN